MSTTVLLKNWNVEEATGYKPMTTFYMDFSIADTFGKKAIENTYARIMEGQLQILNRTCSCPQLEKLRTL